MKMLISQRPTFLSAGLVTALTMVISLLVPIQASNAAISVSGTCEAETSSTRALKVHETATHCYVAFRNIGLNTWTVPAGVTSIDYLIVGGGGGGTSGAGRGGMAGGVVTGSASVVGVTSLDVVVGAGGAGGPGILSVYNSQTSFDGVPGSESVIKSSNPYVNFTALRAYGGDEEPITGNGRGKDIWKESTYWANGGGAGFGSNGGNAADSPTLRGGNGGAGITTPIIDATIAAALEIGEVTNSQAVFAGGGGGGIQGLDDSIKPTTNNRTGGLGGIGGGGAGGGDGGASGEFTLFGPTYPQGVSGLANTGGGGGGGGGDYIALYTFRSGSGGSGGSGVVVIRYSKSLPRTLTVDMYKAIYKFSDVAPKLRSTLSAGGGTVTWASTSTDVCTIDSITGQVSFVSTGECQITSTVSQFDVYAAATESIRFQVGLGSQVISWSPKTRLALGKSPYALNAVSNIGSTISYQILSQGSTNCALSGTNLTYSAVGVCEVKATAASSSNYVAAEKTFEFEITSTIICDIQFGDIRLDVGKAIKIVGTGVYQGDKLLYKNVSPNCGGLDALATTTVVRDANITVYDYNATASLADYITPSVFFTKANGMVEFKYEFFETGTYGTASPVQVDVENFTYNTSPIVPGLWLEFPGAEAYSYLVAKSKTYLVSPTPNPQMRFGITQACPTIGDRCSFSVHYGQTRAVTLRLGSDKPSTRAVSYRHGITPNYGQSQYALGNSEGQQYAIRFEANSATGIPPATYTAPLGSAYTIPTAGTLTKTGHLFRGWNTRADGTGTEYPTNRKIAVPRGGLKLYAIWNPVPRFLFYNVRSSSNESYIEGSVVTVSSTIPVKSGYTFTGWNMAPDGTGPMYQPGSTFVMPGAGVTLYAQWTKTVYLRYDLMGGVFSPSVADPSTKSGGLIAVTDVIPTKAGYFFAGWNAGPIGGSQSYAPGQQIKIGEYGYQIYAQWIENKFDLAYNANGGVGEPGPVSSTSSTINLSDAEPYRHGYTFIGWNTKPDGSGTAYAKNASYTFSGSNKIVLYAQWQVKKFTLSYDANRGSGAPPSVQVDAFGNAVITSAEPTRPGYKFLEWNVLSNGFGQNARAGWNFTMPAENVMLYAMWEAQSVVLRYLDNEGTGSPAEVITRAGASEKISSVRPTRLGYLFSGWNTKADGTGISYQSSQTIESMPESGLELYAKWVPQTFTVTYGLNGGTSTAEVNPNYQGNSNVSLLGSSSVIRSGFDFAGWLDQSTGKVISGSEFLMPFYNVILIAQWQPKTFALTYNTNGGNSMVFESASVDAENTAVVTYQTPTRTAHIFGGWNTASDGTGVFYQGGSRIALSANTTLYAFWYPAPTPPTTKMLTYNAAGGFEAPSPVSVTSGSSITLATSGPVRTGFTFDGWAASLGGAKVTTVTLNEDTTVFARWAVKKYWVTHDLNGGSGSIANTQADFGSSVNITSTKPVRNGYVFAGWNTEENGSGNSYTAGQSLEMPAGDVFLYAMWTPEVASKFKLVYNANGGINSPPIEDVESGTVTLSAVAATRAGYTFDGWAETTTSAKVTAITVASDTTVYARWVAQTYSVAYDAAGGSGAPTAATVATGDLVTVDSTIPTRTGYVFSGWRVFISGVESILSGGSIFTMPAFPVSLEAQWTQQGVILIYNSNGGSGSLSETVSVGTKPTLATSVSATPAFTRSGFTLGGWNNSSLGSGEYFSTGSSNLFVMPPRDTILYAAWEGTDRQLAYSANAGGGSAQNIPVTSTVKAGAGVLISTASPTLSGKKFVGWNTNPDGTGVFYSGLETFFMPDSDTTLYAQWSAQTKNPQKITVSDSGNRTLNQSPFRLAAESESGLPFEYNSLTPSVCTADQFGFVILLSEGSCSITISQAGNSDFDSQSRTITFNVIKPSGGGGTRPISLPDFGSIEIREGKGETNLRGVEKDVKIKSIKPGTGVRDAEVKDGKVIVTPDQSFTGKTSVVLQIEENGSIREITIPVLVNPSKPTSVRHTLRANGGTALSWNKVSNATGYEVFLDGVLKCRTLQASCTIPGLLGPKSELTVVSLGLDETSALPAKSSYNSKVAAPALKVYFAAGSSAISPAERIKIQRFAAMVAAQGFTTVVLQGHTAGIGTSGLAKVEKLAGQRNQSVARLLGKYVKVKIIRQVIAAQKPVASNTTESGQSKNRRVEVQVR